MKTSMRFLLTLAAVTAVLALAGRSVEPLQRGLTDVLPLGLRHYLEPPGGRP